MRRSLAAIKKKKKIERKLIAWFITSCNLLWLTPPNKHGRVHRVTAYIFHKFLTTKIEEPKANLWFFKKKLKRYAIISNISLKTFCLYVFCRDHQLTKQYSKKPKNQTVIIPSLRINITFKKTASITGHSF